MTLVVAESTMRANFWPTCCASIPNRNKKFSERLITGNAKVNITTFNKLERAADLDVRFCGVWKRGMQREHPCLGANCTGPPQ